MSGFLTFSVGVLTLAGFYALVTMVLNLEAGWGGMWDLGLAGLLGVGGYFYAITTLGPGEAAVAFAPDWPIWLAIVGAGVFTAAIAFLIGAPALRLRREYFLITTFAFAEMVRQLFITQSQWTNGTKGLTSPDRPFDDYLEGVAYDLVLLGMVAFAAAVVYLLMRRVGHAPYGILMRAYRDNEPLAVALGTNVARRRVQAFVLAGLLLGLIAPLYVWHIQAIVPAMYRPDITFTAWTALVVGGIGNLRGSVTGAVLLVLFTEGLLFIPVSAERAGLLSAMSPLLLGLALIVVLRLRPEGLMPERSAFYPSSRPGAKRTIRRRLSVLGASGHQEKWEV